MVGQCHTIEIVSAFECWFYFFCSMSTVATDSVVRGVGWC